jgi:transcriptional regulator with XRE-family HTH domain
MTADGGAGARIRRYRRARGLSLDQAAGLAGISKPYLSRLERGERTIDSWSLLQKIAVALEVPVSDLTGQLRGTQNGSRRDTFRGVERVRLALLDPGGPCRSDSEIESLVGGLDILMNSCDMDRQAQIVPNLLGWTQIRADAAGSVEAHKHVAISAYAATFMMRNLGEMDLAWMAADRMRIAAEKTDDRAIRRLAAYAQAHVLAPVGALQRAASVASEAIEEAAPITDEDLASLGSCLLVSATTDAALVKIDEARSRLAEADWISRNLKNPTFIARHTSFAAWNVSLHRVAIDVEAGDPAAAISAAQPIIRTPVKHAERMSYFWVDLGRAYCQLDRYPEAIEAFRRAERVAPVRCPFTGWWRECIWLRCGGRCG